MNRMRELPSILLADVRAWLRGQHRIAPRFTTDGARVRGRIYAPRNAEPIAPLRAKAEPIVNITARHFSPDGSLKGTHVIRGRAAQE